ncbi:hypothetical protein BU15DRAFT_68684 [Melanogaster broomeanus]|nr:hypothetical protein BU15DRAFT_68684 [Melanogaster broomeanus]
MVEISQSIAHAEDTDDPVERTRQRLDSLNSEDVEYVATLNAFANQLMARFKRSGNPKDLDEGVERTKELLAFIPPGLVLQTRFKFRGDAEDLTQAINYLQACVESCPPQHPNYVPFVANLAIGLRTRYSQVGDVSILDEIVEICSTALHQRADRADLDMALTHYQACLDLRPPGHPKRYIILGNLGDVLLFKFQEDGDLQDLQGAASHYVAALQLCSPGQEGYVVLLTGLGVVFWTFYETQGDMQKMEMAIGCYQTALASSTVANLDHVRLLDNYGGALRTRYTKFGDVSDLNQAIQYFTTSYSIQSPSFPGRPITLHLLGVALLTRFNATGKNSDLVLSIEHLASSLQLCAPSSHERPGMLSVYSSALLARFKAEGDAEDLNLAASLCKDALTSLSPGHVNYSSVVATVTAGLLDCFEQTGNIDDVQVIIDHCESALLYSFRDVIQGVSEGHVEHIPAHNGYATALQTRFELTTRHRDLDEAIEHYRIARRGCRPGDTNYVSVCMNLGNALRMRSEYSDDLDALDESIVLLSEVDEILSAAVQELSMQRNIADLNDAIERTIYSLKHFSTAADRMPGKHHLRSRLCLNYGHALVKVAEHRDPIPNLNFAITLYTEAMTRSRNDHYDWPLAVMWLARAVYQRGEILSSTDDLWTAIGLLRGYTQTVPRGTLHFWGHLLQLGDHCDGLVQDFQAYQTALSSLDQHVLSIASVKHRHEALLKRFLALHSSLAADATACAISEGRVELAIELSEHGRGLLWSQMARIRTPLDSLRAVDGEGWTLASEFERLSSRLARSSVPTSNGVLSSRLSLEEGARQYRLLSKEMDAVVERIRAKEGFQSFLRPVSFQDLQNAAAGGPVIIVNVGHRRCDAIIVLHDESPRLVPLPDATIEGITAMSTKFYQTLKATSRAGEEKLREKQLAPILRRLWDTIVGPVVDELAKFLPRGSRIWWCPTSKLTSLPLHATGPYRKGANNLSNIYISSYTPTLAALIRSRKQKAALPNIPPPFIAIGQSKPEKSSGESELEGIDGELDLVESIIPPSMTFDRISGDTATADAATEGLRTHAWAHLACHGNQDLAQPFDSSFSLRDRPLTLLDIIRAEVAHPESAFLSACHTAVGDENTPDEECDWDDVGGG